MKEFLIALLIGIAILSTPINGNPSSGHITPDSGHTPPVGPTPPAP